jgi:hypothetical protein
MGDDGYVRSSFCSGGSCVEVKRQWRRASNCSDTACVEVSRNCADSSCVEVAQEHNLVMVRDSKRPEQEPLSFTMEEWAAFRKGVQAGEFSFGA